VTYTGKKYQKFGDYPKGVRVFAVWISPDLISKDAQWFFRLSTLPKWLAVDLWHDGKFGKTPKRKPGGGWECDGDNYYSPWEFMYGDDDDG
jgi:hypothetical protein